MIRIKSMIFGAFEAEGAKLFFKIDYYDKTLKLGSPNPADPSVTERVITIMLTDEYYAAIKRTRGRGVHVGHVATAAIHSLTR
jgi:hypothetical protein